MKNYQPSNEFLLEEIQRLNSLPTATIKLHPSAKDVRAYYIQTISQWLAADPNHPNAIKWNAEIRNYFNNKQKN